MQAYSLDTGPLQVVDSGYRSARVLHAEKFICDLEQPVLDALDCIAALACTEASSLTATVDKVSIMQACFKPLTHCRGDPPRVPAAQRIQQGRLLQITP